MTDDRPTATAAEAATKARDDCRVCGELTGAERIHIREMMFGTRASFEYRRCQACGSLSIDEIPVDLGRFYPPTYYSNDARMRVEQDPLWRRAAIRSRVGRRAFGRQGLSQRIARRVASVPDAYRVVKDIIEGAGLTTFEDPILDVGCGAMPVRLAILRKVGFRRLQGVEPFLSGDLTYQGVRVKKGELGDIEGRFRLIMFHHSLEHVTDPLATLRQVAARLAPDGRCLIRTPIADGYFWRTYGTDWVELDAPRHIALFSRVGLERLARRAGLEVAGLAWESGAWEFVASEQYRRDIAMYEPGSWFVDRAGGAFDEDHLREYKAEARRRVEEGDAGRAAIWLRRARAGEAA
jgi:SAM-dependent methyltransferase